MKSIIISHPADAGQRLDRFIRKFLPYAPLGGIFKILRTWKIKVNGKKKDQTYRIEIGDEITFWLSDIEIEIMKWNENRDIKNEESNNSYSIKNSIEILYEDEYLIVVNKPAWVNVHPGDHKTTEISLIDQIQDYLEWKYNSLTFRPALVHRIDRDTSGCLLIAKDKQVLESLLSDFQAHKIEKIYHAIVLDIPIKNEGTIQNRLLRIDNAKNEAKVRIDDTGQTAVTYYSVLQNYMSGSQNFSLIECRIETGRTHQIRVHLSHIGHPILWDRSYGNKSINSYINRELQIKRQLLHARSIGFIHPKTHKKIIIEAKYPLDFLKILVP